MYESGVAARQFQNFTRLTSLKISRCENINIPLSQWGLTRLTSLRSLSIHEDIFLDATSFSNDHHSGLLPTTLTSLELGDFKNLESLASISIQKLSSLESLNIAYCPKLRSILPRKKRLPPTLSSLYIEGCQLLEERYSKEKGKDWPKIAQDTLRYYTLSQPAVTLLISTSNTFFNLSYEFLPSYLRFSFRESCSWTWHVTCYFISVLFSL